MTRFKIVGALLLALPNTATGQTGFARTVDINSLQQIDTDVRQIDYFRAGRNESPVKVVVQLNCRTGMHRLVGMSVGTDVMPIYDDEPWMGADSDIADPQLFATVCGEGNLSSSPSTPMPEYPARAFREAREGTAKYRITIAPTGAITNCEITGSSGHTDLDAATCDYAMRLASAVSRPVIGTENHYESSVTWKLPK